VRYAKAKSGDLKVCSWFAILPVTIGNEVRQWERVRCVMRLVERVNCPGLEWIPVMFLEPDDDDEDAMKRYRERKQRDQAIQQSLRELQGGGRDATKMEVG